MRRLAVGGQIVEAPADAIKDPYVLEFLELKEETSYSEATWRRASSTTCKSSSLS